MMVLRAPAGEWVWLWREVRTVARQQVLGLFCVMSAAAIGLTGPLLMKWLIDDILPNRRWNALPAMTLLFFATWFGRVVLSGFGQLVNAVAVQRTIQQIRARLVAHVQTLPAAFHRQQPVGELMQRLERDVQVVGDSGSDLFPSMVRMIVETAMTVSVMIVLDWRISAIVLPLVPVFAVVRHYFRPILQTASEAMREATGRQSGLLHELLTGAIQIQLLGAEPRIARRYWRLSLRAISHTLVLRRYELYFTLCSMGIVGIGMASIIGYGGARVLAGNLTTGGLVAFYGYVGGLFSPVTTAVELYARMNRVRASIRRLIALEQASGTLVEAEDAAPLAAVPRRIAGENVSFRYGDLPTLRRIAFDVRSGERVAVVGESGCGKSTLLQLIPRLYDVGDGRIAIDGKDVRGLQVKSLRRAISFVPQQPVLFQGTLRDNIRCACPTATPREIEHAAWITCLTDVIERLPLGWNTELGHGGAGLSGGEQQRLAIARALLLDRPILILDEATSALDAITEHRLLTRLEGWCAGRLVIIVSHRLAAARWADRVVVLQRGEVIEEGPHERLLSQDGYYRALWRSYEQEESPVSLTSTPAAP